MVRRCRFWSRHGLRALVRLQRLKLVYWGANLQLSSSLHQLTALRKLSLGARLGRVVIDPAVRLPPAVEVLEFGDWNATALPEQASGVFCCHGWAMHLGRGLNE